MLPACLFVNGGQKIIDTYNGPYSMHAQSRLNKVYQQSDDFLSKIFFDCKYLV